MNKERLIQLKKEASFYHTKYTDIEHLNIINDFIKIILSPENEDFKLYICKTSGCANYDNYIEELSHPKYFTRDIPRIIRQIDKDIETI